MRNVGFEEITCLIHQKHLFMKTRADKWTDWDFETLKFKIHNTFKCTRGGSDFKKLGQCRVGRGEGTVIDPYIGHPLCMAANWICLKLNLNIEEIYSKNKNKYLLATVGFFFNWVHIFRLKYTGIPRFCNMV